MNQKAFDFLHVNERQFCFTKVYGVIHNYVLDFYFFSIYTSRFCIRIVNNSVKIVSDKLKAKESQNTKLCHTDDDTSGPVLQLCNISQFSLTPALAWSSAQPTGHNSSIDDRAEGEIASPQTQLPFFFQWGH